MSKSTSKTAPHFEWDGSEHDRMIKPLFRSRKAELAATRGWQEGGVHLFGGIMSDDPTQLKFIDLVTKTLDKQIPVNVDDFGRVYGSGIRSSWFGARHVAGYPATRGTWPLYDNSLKRRAQALSDKIVQPWHRNLYEAWIRLAFSDIVPEPMRIRKGASSCVPSFDSSPSGRIEIAEQAFADAALAGSLCLKGKYEEAFLKYGIGGAYYVVYRRQSSDKITYDPATGKWEAKERRVADLEYALSGGSAGNQVISDKSFGKPGDPQVPAGFFRQRLRTATGVSGSIGASLTPIAQSVRTRIYDKWAFTYHHTTRLQKQGKVKQFDFTIPADVSDHDINWPLWIVDSIAVPTLLSMGFADWWVELFRLSFHMPVYASCPADGEGQTLIGDWRKPDGNLGLCSGNPFTDLMGSWNMTVVYAMIQIEHTARHHIQALKTVDGAVRWLDAYMKGELEIALMDKSDDALLLWGKNANLHLAHDLMQSMKDEKQVNDYMVVSYEHGGAFLGDVLLYGANRDLRDVILIGNGNSLLVNTMAPEYGAALDRSNSHAGFDDRQRSKRPYPGLAWEATIQVYGSIPCFQEIMDITEFAWRKTHGGSYRALRQQLLMDDRALLRADMLRQKIPGLDVGSLDAMQIDVLAATDRLDWRYAPSDIGSAIVELVSSTVSLEKVEPYFNSIVPRR